MTGLSPMTSSGSWQPTFPTAHIRSRKTGMPSRKPTQTARPNVERPDIEASSRQSQCRPATMQMPHTGRPQSWPPIRHRGRGTKARASLLSLLSRVAGLRVQHLAYAIQFASRQPSIVKQCGQQRLRRSTANVFDNVRDFLSDRYLPWLSSRIEISTSIFAMCQPALFLHAFQQCTHGIPSDISVLVQNRTNLAGRKFAVLPDNLHDFALSGR